MITAIVVVWTVGLLGALLATLVIAKESLLLIRTLQDTLRMARVTAKAARGVEGNLAAVSSLSAVGDALRPLDAAMADLAATLEQLGARLTAVLR
jgi:hypothetical protein